MDRITLANLQAIVARINRITGSPAEAYTRQPDGSLKANVGHFHLDQAYGGVTLHRMYNEGGGVTDVLGGGHFTRRECYHLLHAFIRGFDLADAMHAGIDTTNR